MPAVITTILERSDNTTKATAYEAVNTLKYNFFNDLIANKPSNWVLISSVIPTPSTTTYQSFQAIFEIDGLYRVQFRGYSLSDTTTPTGQSYLYMHLMDTSGNYTLGNSSTGNTNINLYFQYISTLSATSSLHIKIECDNTTKATA